MIKNDFFASEFVVGEVPVGGRHSRNPTVLIGSIFYMRHKIVKDEKSGDFDEEQAAQLIRECETYSDKLGVGFMLDVVGSTPEALMRYIRFIKEVSPSPILLNSTSPETRMSVLKQLAEENMLDRIVYNSINAFTTEDELDVLENVPIEAAIIQAYNPKSKKPEGPLKALQGKDNNGLLHLAEKCNVRNDMIDIPALDLSGLGIVAHSARLIQEKLGLPVGSAPANATYTGTWLRDRSKVSREQFKAVDAAVNTYLVANGCNFSFFGPIEGAHWVFPAVAVADAMNIYGAKHLGIVANNEMHPMFRVL